MTVTNERLASLWQEGVQLMAEGYTCAEVTLRVLVEAQGWDPSRYHWATAGYAGAIRSGRTTCGLLFGATIFLGLLQGEDAAQAPEIGSEGRSQAIASVNGLYCGFIEQFGDTDCRALTGCDWSSREDVKRYFREEVYTTTCYRCFEYVLGQCLDQMACIERPSR